MAVNRNEVFYYLLPLAICFGPCGPSSSEYFLFLRSKAITIFEGKAMIHLKMARTGRTIWRVEGDNKKLRGD
jgi:hypothetical protein